MKCDRVGRGESNTEVDFVDRRLAVDRGAMRISADRVRAVSDGGLDRHRRVHSETTVIDASDPRAFKCDSDLPLAAELAVERFAEV